jgi:hypothetical protein
MTTPAPDSANPTPDQPPQTTPGTISIEFPLAFWQAVEALAQKGGVTPESVISAGASLYSLALQAREQRQKIAVIELDQPCITEVTGF